MRQINGVPVAIIGHAFPHTPIANPRYFVPECTFGIREKEMQKVVGEARAKAAQVVVLLPHYGMDVDLKMASRVSGIDAILGRHTHDGVPQPTLVANRGGKTIVTNAGSNAKFLAVLDFDAKAGELADFRYRLLPVFSALLPPDAAIDALIHAVRAPYLAKLDEKLATTERLRYRRGSFNGTSDRLILEAPLAEKNAEFAFSPGYRWGTTLMPGHVIRMEHLMDQTVRHIPVCDGQRNVRRDDQEHSRGSRRLPVQSGPVLPAGRRQGTGRWPQICAPEGERGQAHHPDGTCRQPARRAVEVQGGRPGARLGSGEGSPAARQAQTRARAICAQRRRSRREPSTCPSSKACRAIRG
jgi:hypothetical protein